MAELTGRTRRLVYNELTGETRFEERGEGANLQERRRRSQRAKSGTVPKPEASVCLLAMGDFLVAP